MLWSVYEGSQMNHLFATAIFGLAASPAQGSGDFGGGLASRRTNAESVVLAAHGGRLDVAAILSSLIGYKLKHK